MTMMEKNERCPECGQELRGSLTYCDRCGHQINCLCPHCDSLHSASTKFCPDTGKAIRGGSSSPDLIQIIAASFRLVTSRLNPGLTAALIAFMCLGAILANVFSRQSAVIPPVKVSFQPISAPRIDVVFALDTTGSMSDEIQTVKEKIKSMADEIRKGTPRPDVRFGLVIFRDKGDSYVVKSYPFTRDIQSFSSLIGTVSAGGGGDTPESVNEALDVAINRMGWDKGQTQKLLFLIGDAGPHTDYDNGLDYSTLASQAAAKGINIYTVACSGMDSFGDSSFRTIAENSGGSFDCLTYQVAYQAPSGEVHYMLNAGGRSYKVDRDTIHDGSWKKGACDMERSGRAHAMSRSDAASMPGGSACLSATESMVSAGEAKNNLDSLMTGVIKEKAEKAGVRY